METPTAKHFVWLTILSVLWSATFIFVKIADHDFDPVTLMAGRAVVSFLMLWLLLVLGRRPFKHYFFQIKQQFFFFVSSVLIAFMWYSIAACEKVITAAMTSLLITALVVFSWIIATFFVREKPFYIINFIGIIVAIVGVATMIGYHNLIHANHNLYYALLYLSGLLSFAIAIAFNKSKCHHVDPFVTTAFNLFYIAIILSVASLWWQQPFAHHYRWSSLISVVALGLMSTGIGYLIYFWLAHHVGQVFAAMNSYLVPVFGFLMGVWLLHEPFYGYQIIGLLIVLFGLFLTNKRKMEKHATNKLG